MVRLILGCMAAAFAALAFAPAAYAQFAPDPPEIAAKKAEIMNAPLDQRVALEEQLLKLIAARYGADSDEYAQQLGLYSTDLNFAHRPRDAQKAMEQAIAILAKRHGESSFEAAGAKQNYALTLIINGFKDQAVAPYRDYVAAMTEEAYGCGRIKEVPGGRMVMGCIRDEKDLGDDLVGYGQLLADLGRAAEGVAAFEDVIKRFTPRWDGCDGPEWGTRCETAAFDRRDFMSDFARYLIAIDQRERGLSILRDVTVPRLDALAGCTADACHADYWLLSDYRTYRAAVEGGDPAAALALDEKWLPILGREPIYARAKADGAEYFDKQYREGFDELATTYAKAAVAAGRGDQALAVLEPLGFADRVAGADAGANYETRLADLKQQYQSRSYFDYSGRADIRKQIAELERARHGEKSSEYGDALRDVALELKNTDDKAATEDYFRRALAVMRAGFGDDNFHTLYTLSYLSDWLTQQGRKADAISILRVVVTAPANDHSAVYADPVRSRLLAAGMGAINEPDGELNLLKSDLAHLLLETGGDADEALAAARHAAVGKRAYRHSFGFSNLDESAYDMATDDSNMFNGPRKYGDYFTLFADALWNDGQRAGGAAEEAFLALQEVQMGTTSRAVAKAAAERTLQQAGVANLLEQRKQIDADIAKLDAEQMTITAPDERERQRLIRVNSDARARANFQRDEVDQRIAAASPGYFELVRPRALALADAQALLAPDEAFLMIVPGEFGIHSILVTHDKLVWHRSDMTRADLNQHVRRLLWDAGADVDVTPEEDERWRAEGEGDFPFDRGTAFLLYQQLVAPLAADLAGKRHLFTAAVGSLSSLPLEILVTEQPAGADGDPAVLRATHWFGDGPAILQLPSLQSLQLLRAVARRSDTAARDRMIGFGDPVLDGVARQRGGDGSGRPRFDTRGAGLPVSDGLQQPSGDGPPLADPATLRKLARLPGTEAELKAMQGLLGPDHSRLFLAANATETNVKRAPLDGLSVLFLATHGLVAGELQGVAEPGLVFTPPKAATAADDGLLTASEVAALHLGARWVILSACNTAAGDGSAGAPAMSGLARAFFFAGAESLLASHWPVRDDVASVLTVRLFQLMRDDPGLSRAEALQRAEREIRDDPRRDAVLQSWAHPSAWAPFSLIGDGIR